jgi:RND superfamily putative drug exporter
VIGVVHQVTVGLTADMADAFGSQVSTTLAPLLVVVLFGIGTDYIVFLLFRYRERLRAGTGYNEALELAGGVVGKVIASSALTVIGAFAALWAAHLRSLSCLAPGLVVAVALMLVTALTLVPAVFSLLGDKLFWPYGPGGAAKRNPFAAEGRLVGKRHALVGPAVALVMAGLSVAALGYTATYNTLGELPSSTKSLVAYNTLATGFPPGALGPTQVYVSGPRALAPSSLDDLEAKLAGVPGVARVGRPQLSQDGKAALVSVVLRDDPYSNQALDVVEDQLRPAVTGSVPRDSVLVGGVTATSVDVRHQLGSDTRHVFPLAGLIILLILGLLLTSALAPLNLLVVVALAFAATLGAAVLVFLDGLGRSGVDFSLPIVLYLFVVAIGTDYNILISSRLREEHHNGLSPAEAARVAISNDGPTVAAAGVILAPTFSSLMLAGITNLVELGFGVAAGVVIAAFVMAPLLVPNLSALEGRPFWWPGPKKQAAGTLALVSLPADVQPLARRRPA